MARHSQPAPGARDGSARQGDSPDNATSRDELTADTSAATPAQPDIVPEPFNPNFLDRNAENTEVGSGVPGLGGGDNEDRVTVETTGEFMLQDPYTLDLVPANGSESVRRTSFITEKLLAGQLKEV